MDEDDVAECSGLADAGSADHGIVDPGIDEPLDDDVAPRRLSPSGAATFRQCPRRWRFRYLEGRPDPPGVPALVGSFVHRILELLLAEPAVQRTIDRSRFLARSLWPEVAADDDFAGLRLDDRAERGFRWRAWRAVEGYFAVEDPAQIDVARREQRLETEVGGVPFIGVVDRTEHTAEGLVVTDYKTGRKPSARFAADRLEQVLLYSAALDAADQPVRRARLLYLGAGPVEVETTAAAVGPAVDRLRSTWDAIEDARTSDAFPPKPGPLCPWCPYQTDCPEGRVEVERRLGPAA